MLTFYHSPMSRSSAIATLIRELGAEAAVETRLVSIPRVDGSGGHVAQCGHGPRLRRRVVHRPDGITHSVINGCQDAPVAPRFLTLADVAETLNISASQTYALVRNGDLPAIKVGGRGQWRVEATELEAYIARMYAETADFVRTHPFTKDDEDADAEAEDAAEPEDSPAAT